MTIKECDVCGCSENAYEEYKGAMLCGDHYLQLKERAVFSFAVDGIEVVLKSSSPLIYKDGIEALEAATKYLVDARDNSIYDN